jgi:hypothetical protein
MPNLTKETLKDAYENNTVDKAARKLKMSIPTLLKYVKEAGIPLKSKVNGKKPPKFRII